MEGGVSLQDHYIYGKKVLMFWADEEEVVEELWCCMLATECLFRANTATLNPMKMNHWASKNHFTACFEDLNLHEAKGQW
ncbi:hypothetical protein PM082_016604 [Marasmius tenuissimus]|nr:hypothetical protein PM082_016604 [Marasmius tenuissimus]